MINNVKIIKKKKFTLLLVDNMVQMNIPNDKSIINNMSEILFINKIDNFVNDNSNVLCIGLGAGYTAKEILKRRIKNLDIVEVYQSVIDNLKNFDTYDDIVNNKKCNIICDDAKNYVLNTNKKYDIIIIDVCQPTLDISKDLFKLEFFIDLKKILNDNGIILFWYYILNTRDRKETAKLMIKNFKKVFNFVDFIYIKESITKDTYLFISDKITNVDENSIIDKLFLD
ncbi:MAG: spermidine synthase [bacterium]